MTCGIFGMTFLLDDLIILQIVYSMKSYSYQLCKMSFILKCFQKLNPRYVKFVWPRGCFVIKDICISMAIGSVQLAISRASTMQRIKTKSSKHGSTFGVSLTWLPHWFWSLYLTLIFSFGSLGSHRSRQSKELNDVALDFRNIFFVMYSSSRLYGLSL